MRIIDADALIPNEVHTIIRLTATGEQMESVVYAEQIDNAPTIEAIPVVRCKDCRWHEDEQPRYSGQKVYCPAVVGGWVDGDWFCKGGERKDDDNNEI